MLVKIVLFAALAFVLYRLVRLFMAPAPMPAAAADGARAGDPAVAYISHGKVFCSVGGAPGREIQSSYVQASQDRIERSRELHAWKEGTAFGVSARRGKDDCRIDIQATSAQFLGADRVLYFLRDDAFGGLFQHDLATGTELRLMHRQRFWIEDLAVAPDGQRLLCTHYTGKGLSNIATMNLDGSDFREATGGDTVDSSPAWVHGQADSVVFESSGIARSPQGAPIGHGPTSLQLLDLAKGTLTTVFDDPKFDFLSPRVGRDGALYFIRRPYEPPVQGIGRNIADALLFPLRLLRALFHYLNFFSLMYSRKPLSSASGVPMEADIKEIVLKRKRVDAERALRSGVKIGGAPSVVPATWELVRRNDRGEEFVLARHVAAFDLGEDDRVVFTNGFGVFVLDGNRPRVLFRDKLIAQVTAGPAATVAPVALPTEDAKPGWAAR